MINVWTDGSCFPNPGPAAWAFLIRYPNGREETNTGASPHSTNNRAEMTAVLMAMRALPYLSEPVIHTDSMYVVQGFDVRSRRKRQENNYLTGAGEIPNADLWRLLYAEGERVRPMLRWIKGHSGIPENERCDRLAAGTQAQLVELMVETYDPVHVAHLRDFLHA